MGKSMSHRSKNKYRPTNRIQHSEAKFNVESEQDLCRSLILSQSRGYLPLDDFNLEKKVTLCVKADSVSIVNKKAKFVHQWKEIYREEGRTEALNELHNFILESIEVTANTDSAIANYIKKNNYNKESFINSVINELAKRCIERGFNISTTFNVSETLKGQVITRARFQGLMVTIDLNTIKPCDTELVRTPILLTREHTKKEAFKCLPTMLQTIVLKRKNDELEESVRAKSIITATEKGNDIIENYYETLTPKTLSGFMARPDKKTDSMLGIMTAITSLEPISMVSFR